MRLAGSGLNDQRAKRLGSHAGDMEGASFTAALHKRHDVVLLRCSLCIGAVLLRAADDCFVRLDKLAFPTDRAALLTGHSLANTMRHEPCALVGYSQHAMELMRRDALFRGGHQMRGQQPLVQRNMRSLV